MQMALTDRRFAICAVAQFVLVVHRVRRADRAFAGALHTQRLGATLAEADVGLAE